MDEANQGIGPAASAATGARRVPALRPLLFLAPFLLRHPGVLALSVAALVVSAAALLTLPVAVRRMIDLGFSGKDGAFVDRYLSLGGNEGNQALPAGQLQELRRKGIRDCRNRTLGVNQAEFDCAMRAGTRDEYRACGITLRG